MSTSESYRRGMAAYNSADYEQAIGLLEPLVGDTPRTTRATTLLSRFYLGQAHHELALRHFRQMRFQEAASHFDQAARLNPVGGGVERFLTACYMKTGRYDEAGQNLEALLSRRPDDIEARIRLALTLWEQSARDKAVETLTEGIERQPDQAELHYQLGAMHAAREDIEQAQGCFAAAIARDAHHAAAHERLAQCCCLMGEYHRALELLQRAVVLDPRNAHIGLQLSLLAQGMPGSDRVTLPGDQGQISDTFDRASLQRLGEIVTCEPEFVDAFLSLPTSDVDREVFSALAATLEHALAQHPEYADLHYHCGEVYRRLGKNADAIAHAEQAVRINPRYVNALILLAGLYAQTQREADGVQRLEEAIRQGGNHADVHYMLGRLYQRTGQASRARNAFQRALALDDNLQAAKEALNSLATAGT